MKSILALLAVTVAGCFAASPIACRVSQQGASYDVNYLSNPAADWVWNDAFNMETRNLTYTFNICRNVVNIPSLCGTTYPAIYPVFQTTNDTLTNTVTCTPIGDIGNSLMTLYDTTDPSAGAVLTYKGGPTACPTGLMAFSINFQCADFPFPSPVGPYSRFMHFIEQVNNCQYVAWAPSQAGCPQECPIVNGAVCSGKGICGYDTNGKTARCFCDDGYDENDCNTPRSPFPAGAVAGSTIGGLALGAAGIFGWSFFAARRMGGAGAGGGGGSAVEGFYGQI